MTHETKTLEIGDDFRITSIKNRNVAGSWVFGMLNGHQFQALVFPEHAEVESYELGQSRISKLWLQELATRRRSTSSNAAKTARPGPGWQTISSTSSLPDWPRLYTETKPITTSNPKGTYP